MVLVKYYYSRLLWLRFWASSQASINNKGNKFDQKFLSPNYTHPCKGQPINYDDVLKFGKISALKIFSSGMTRKLNDRDPINAYTP